MSNNTNNRTTCPHCPSSSRLFAAPHGLNIHIGRKHKSIRHNAVDTNNFQTQPLSYDPHIQTNLDSLAKLKASVPVLKHIPKGARAAAADKLRHLIEQCIETNGHTEWYQLLSFSFTSLRIPSKLDPRSLTSKVKENIHNPSPDNNSGEPPLRPGAPSISNLVESKVHDGDLRGAVRLLTSECSIAPASEETLISLRSKHPSPSRYLDFPPEPNLDSPFLTVSVADVQEALSSFHNGSAAGLDGLRPEHIKELTAASAGDSGQKLLESLTKLCNFLLKGLLNREVCPYLYGASLCAFLKKDGGIRPIAIGSTIRRLVAKLGCRSVKNELASYLQPVQVGFGTPLGCEAAIHATRAFAFENVNTSSVLKS